MHSVLLGRKELSTKNFEGLATMLRHNALAVGFVIPGQRARIKEHVSIDKNAYTDITTCKEGQVQTHCELTLSSITTNSKHWLQLFGTI